MSRHDNVIRPASQVRTATSVARQRNHKREWKKLMGLVANKIAEAASHGDCQAVISFMPQEFTALMEKELDRAGYTVKKTGSTLVIGWYDD